MIRLAFPCVAAALVAGCAIGPNVSFVSGVQRSSDARVLGRGVAEFAAARLPDGGTIALDPPISGQAGNAVTPVLTAALRRRGFGVVEGKAPAPPGAHRLRYLVTPLDNGDLVRVTLDGSTSGARFFARNTAGGLQAGGPYTVTQAETSQ